MTAKRQGATHDGGSAVTARGGLGRLFGPRTVAVIGASPDPDKLGNVLMRSLACFPGPVYAVHPQAKEVLGRPAFPRIQDVPETVDLALFAIPPQAVPETLRGCAEARVGSAIVHSGGWAETGGEGAALQDEVIAVAREGGIRILGPNTSGLIVPPARLCASFDPKTAGLTPGGLGLVVQSGGFNHALAFLAHGEGLGIRLAVGLGNAVDVGWADVLDYLAEDDLTRVVALAIEGLVDGRALVEAIERLVDRVPVVAFKVGRTDVGEIARSHTGALTGSWRVARAALAQAGAVVVDDATELIDAARALAATRLAPSPDPGVGVVTGQAGPGIVLTDALGVAGVPVPELPDSTREELKGLLPPITYQRNPVDTGRPGPTFGDVIRAVGRAPCIDLIAVSQLHVPEETDLGALPTDGPPVVLATQGPPEEIRVLRDTLASRGVPAYPAPERAARAVAALVRDARAAYRRRSAQETAEPELPVPELEAGGDGWDEDRAKALFEALAIATPLRAVCATHEEALAAFRRLGPGVAVKLLHAEVTHKTDVGGVHLDVRDEEALAAALEAIDRTPGGRYLVEAMAPPGPELLLGARHDPLFGPIVVLGSGGIAAEADEDVSVRLAPVSPVEARSMLDELRGARRYRGDRGAPPVDEDELAAAIVALGRLIVGRPDIAEIEANPLRVTAEGLLALDAVVVPA